MERKIDEIHKISKILNETMDNPWCITGSAAIFYYLYTINDTKSLYFMDKIGLPNDIDILVKNKRRNSNLDYRYVGDYKRTSNIQLRSTTYKNDEGLFLDLTFETSVSIKKVGDTYLHNPKSLLRDYEDFLEDLDFADEKFNKNLFKIEALKYIKLFTDDFENFEDKKRKNDDEEFINASAYVPHSPLNYNYNSP